MNFVNHTFSFDPSLENDILAYRYGDGKTQMTSSEVSIRQFGKSSQATHISGVIPLGESLYVKWRNKASNEVFEDTVDLRPLLPKDMENQHIYFVIQGSQLFVYVTDRKTLRPKEMPIVGPFKSQFWVTRQIHPSL
jgi:hypothetical protein